MQSHLAVALDRVPPDSEGWESVWQGLIPPLAALAFQGRTIEAEPFERVVAAIGVLGRLRNAALASHWPGIVAKLRALPPHLLQLLLCAAALQDVRSVSFGTAPRNAVCPILLSRCMLFVCGCRLMATACSTASPTSCWESTAPSSPVT